MAWAGPTGRAVEQRTVNVDERFGINQIARISLDKRARRKLEFRTGSEVPTTCLEEERGVSGFAPRAEKTDESCHLFRQPSRRRGSPARVEQHPGRNGASVLRGPRKKWTGAGGSSHWKTDRTSTIWPILNQCAPRDRRRVLPWKQGGGEGTKK